MRRLPALLAAACLVGGCAISGSSASAPATQSATPLSSAPATTAPSPAPSPAPSVTPGPAIALGTWTPVAVGGAHEASASGILVTEAATAVSGAASVGGEDWHGAVWVEDADGTWSEIQAPDGWRHVWLADIGASPDGYVAVGTRILGETLDPEAGLHVEIEGSVWRSDDLRTWTEAQRLAGADIGWVVPGEDGWVAAGGYAPDGSGGCWHGCATGVGLWWSRDGARWAPAVREPDPAYRLAGIGYSADTGFLAVATVGFTGDDRGFVATWRSADGREWTRIDDPEGLAGAQVSGVSATPEGGFAAVANDFDFETVPSASVFTSADGVRWTPMPSGTPNLWGIARLGEGFVGWQNLFQDPAYGVWTSTDLATWTQGEAYPDFFAERMAGGSRVFATAGPTQEAALWVATAGLPDR